MSQRAPEKPALHTHVPELVQAAVPCQSQSHGEQSVSELALQSATLYVRSGQLAVQAAHTASACAEHGLAMKEPVGQVALQEAHWRLRKKLQGLVSYSLEALQIGHVDKYQHMSNMDEQLVWMRCTAYSPSGALAAGAVCGGGAGGGLVLLVSARHTSAIHHAAARTTQGYIT